MKKICILGGDIRQMTVADHFIDKGYDVSVLGIDRAKEDKKYNYSEDLYDAVSKSDVCILPLPFSRDNASLNAPLYDGTPIMLSDIVEMLDHKTAIYGGRLNKSFVDRCESKGIRVVDYFENESLCIKNALLTAEAALDIVMNELPITIDSSRTAVIGYGRIGKLLSGLLVRMNSRVTVAARRREDRAFAECMGSDTVAIDAEREFFGLLPLKNGYDVIFNTVPACLIDKRFINVLNEKTVIIDLASPPGGVDIRAAREKGIRVIWALSLPGKYAPYRAGRIIAESICESMEDTV